MWHRHVGVLAYAGLNIHAFNRRDKSLPSYLQHDQMEASQPHIIQGEFHSQDRYDVAPKALGFVRGYLQMCLESKDIRGVRWNGRSPNER